MNTTSRQGSTILPTLLIMLIIITASASYLSMSFNEYKMAYRNSDLQSSINLAEGGIEEALLAMKTESWTDWTEVTTQEYYKQIANLDLGNGRTGTVNVYASVIDNAAPVVFAEGSIASSYGTIAKQIRLDLSRRGLFANGLTAKDTISMNGNKVSVDSYNSDYGAPDPSLNRNDKGSVGSVSVAVAAVDIQNADIWGYVATGGGAPDIGKNGSVLGADSPSGINVDWSRIATDFYAEFDDVSAPSMTSPNTSIAGSSVGIAGAGVPEYYHLSDLDLGNKDVLVVDGPVVMVIDDTLDVKGEIQISTTGSLELYVTGDVNIGGTGAVNMTNIPENLLIYGTSSAGQQIKLSGNGALTAAIYAPNADLELKGSGNSGVFNGAAVADTITLVGNYEFHYDEALSDFGAESSYKINRWRELVSSDERVPLNDPNLMSSFATSYSDYISGN